MRVDIGIVGAAYMDDTRPVSAQECINWIPEVAETQGARSVASLKDAPGHVVQYTIDASTETTGIRNMLAVTATGTVANPNPSRLYQVVGSKLAISDPDGFESFASGASIQGYEMVEMAYNGTSLLILAPGTYPKLYAYYLNSSPAVQATLAASQILYTAVPVGTLGDLVSVEYISTGETDEALAVSVSSQKVTVTLATFGDDRGDYDASGDVWPSTGGSGGGGAIQKNDSWTISVAGTLGGTDVDVGDTIRALQNTPGQSSANWIINGVVPISTADEIIAAVLASGPASALVVPTLDGNGEFVEAAMSETNLSGGIDAVAQAIYDITTRIPFIAGSLSFCNGYYLVSEKGGGRWCRSNLNSTIFSGLDIATAESSTDNLLRVFEDHGDAWLFGLNTIEIWPNTGNGSFAFERNSGATINHGLGAVESVASIDNGVFWLGADGIVYRANGYSPVRISTYAIEQDISAADYSNAVAFTYRNQGHTYYVLNLDGRTGRQQRKTWVYDLSTQLWHRRKTDGMENWRILFYQRFAGEDIGASNVLEDEVPIYQILNSAKTEAGLPLIRERKTGYVFKEQSPITMVSLELVMNTGTASILQNPMVEMRYSDNFGASWCMWKQRSLGLFGQWGKRIRFTQLGQFRDRLFHIRVSDPVQGQIVSAVGSMAERKQQ